MMFDPKIRLTSRGIRWLSAACLTVILVAFGTYVSSRLRATYRLAKAVAIQEEEFHAYKEQADAIHESLAVRLDALERTVYATADQVEQQRRTSPPPPRSVERWQINRDMELRNRIRELERWRLDQQNKGDR